MFVVDGLPAAGAHGPSAAGSRLRRLPPEVVARARPVSSAASRLLPVLGPLRQLFPDGALRRGTTVAVTGLPGLGATTLALSLLASASAGGSWCAAAGLADPGVAAVAELGVDLRRVVFVPDLGARWAEVAAELLDGVDVVVVRPPARVSPAPARRLAARARERQAVLVVLTSRAQGWPARADLSLGVVAAEWHGVGRGHGHLRSRQVAVETLGRGSAGRPARRPLWLPSAGGTVARLGQPA